MEYITKIAEGRGCFGQKKFVWLKYDGEIKWRSVEYLSKRHGLSKAAIRNRLTRGSPLDIRRQELINLTKENGTGGRNAAIRLYKATILCGSFLHTPSHMTKWDQFHKQGTDDWKACTRCEEDRPPSEYHGDSKQHKSMQICIACHNAFERGLKARAAA